MTIDEAIRHCEEVAEENEEIYEAHCRIYSKEVVEKYPSPPCKKCAEEHRQLAEWLKELKAYKEQSGDAISREAAIDIKTIAPIAPVINGEAVHYEEVVFVHDLEKLPSVTPQQRIGRWIKTRLDDEPDKICDDCGTYCWKCSICGSDASGWGNYKYCPKCGAKMEVEE